MCYKISKYLIIFSFLLQFSTISAQYVPFEQIYKVHYNPLLQKIKGLNDFYGNIKLASNTSILPLNGTSFAPNEQQLMRYNGKIYLFVAQTGFIFQMSEPEGDSVVFRKIDKTININYNIDCTFFIYKDQIYNYGGYGFWNKSAHFRKYNTVDHEWDIQPTNIEVFTADFEWFSPTEGRLYVPFQKLENKGLKDPKFKDGGFEYSSYYLDIQTSNWIKIGRASKGLIKLIDQKNNYASFLHDKGMVFIINDEAYLFDYLQNKIYKSKRADLNQFFNRNNLTNGIFYYKGIFYKYQIGEQPFKQMEFNLNDFELLDFPIWSIDYNQIIITMAICIFVIILAIIGWLINRSIKNKIKTAQLKALKTKTMNLAFTEVETSLIQLLLNANSKKQNVEMAEINHVLGIKDKNIGLQKKVRSDVMNAINDKYMFMIQGETNLINSVRKEDDKRFFEYYIEPTEVQSIQKWIEKN